MKDISPGGYAVSVKCLNCGKMRRLADMLIDPCGPAFEAYFCDNECYAHWAVNTVLKEVGWTP